MGLVTVSFAISRGGDGLNNVVNYIFDKIGLDSFLIREIRTEAINENSTSLTLVYKSNVDDMVTSVAPREGSIFSTTLVPDGMFDLRLMMSSKIDPASLTSGCFLVDGAGLDTSKVSIDTSGNNYYLRVNLSGYTSVGFHSYRIDNTKITRLDGTKFPYPFLGGYTFHTQSSAHLGDRQTITDVPIRGRVRAGYVPVTSGASVREVVNAYLNNRGISQEFLLAYSSTTRPSGLTEVYLLYVAEPEPQIIQGFPLTQSLFPDVSAPSNVTLVFSTKLDRNQLSSVPGLFTIESQYGSSVSVSPSDITVLADDRTVVINTTSYFTSQKVYSIVARPGIRSIAGTVKDKPDQWTILVNQYEGGGGGIDSEIRVEIAQTDVLRRIAFRGMGA